MNDAFCCHQLPAQANLFCELEASVQFEDLGKGRRGTVLVRPDEERGVPIVRTTARYESPANCFGEVHEKLATLIQEAASLEKEFNNALIEVYTNQYAKMGFHSDLALDLEDESFIALYSCYRDPQLAEPPRRVLAVQSKEDEKQAVRIPLPHNSVVVFSLAANQKFKHSILLDRSKKVVDNDWLGVTFRTSATFVKNVDDQTLLEDGTPLMLADEGQRKAFYSLRGQENRETDFTYPAVSYTISASDLMPPR